MKNSRLIDNGKKSWEWACSHMGIINEIVNQNINNQPLKGLRLGLSLHVTKETSVLVIAATKLGSKIATVFSKSLISTRGHSSISFIRRSQRIGMER